MLPRAITLCAYGGGAAALVLPLVFPLMPGTVLFFIIHALGFALATFLLTRQRKHAWESAGLKEGPPWLPEWAEAFPAWTFESAFLIHLVDLPLAIGMATKVFSDTDAFSNAATLSLQEMPENVRYGPALFLEHYIFATHSGIFLGDFALYYSRPDLKYLAHHLCGIFLLMTGSFWGKIPGVTLLAFCTPVLEIGSVAYCAWALWRTKRTYIWLMNLSNMIYLIVLLLLHCWNDMPTIFPILGIALIVGRTWQLKTEFYKRKKA